MFRFSIVLAIFVCSLNISAFDFMDNRKNADHVKTCSSALSKPEEINLILTDPGLIYQHDQIVVTKTNFDCSRITEIKMRGKPS